MKILITGGTGLIGSHLIPTLLNKGMSVNVLSRTVYKSDTKNLNYFKWDIEKKEIDSKSLEGVDCIIHLAGAGIAEKKWSDDRKKILIDSRVKSLDLIYSALQNKKIKPKKLISTSGIGYYGAKTTDQIFIEKDKPGSDFISLICQEWEKAALNFQKIGMEVFIPRVGVVLTKKGGALERMKGPTKFNVGSPLGSGKQWMPWVHVEDLVNTYLYAIEKNLTGIFNVVSKEHVNNKIFSKTLAKVLNKAHFMPNVPSFILRGIFGEMAVIILEGSRVSNEKLIMKGFKFKFTNIETALNDLC